MKKLSSQGKTSFRPGESSHHPKGGTLVGTALRRPLQIPDQPRPAPEDTVEAASLSLGKDLRIPELIYFRLWKILEHLPGVSNKLTEHKCTMSLLFLKCFSLGEISSVKYTL